MTEKNELDRRIDILWASDAAEARDQPEMSIEEKEILDRADRLWEQDSAEASRLRGKPVDDKDEREERALFVWAFLALAAIAGLGLQMLSADIRDAEMRGIQIERR